MAFPEAAGYSMISADGEYTGLIADFVREISKYTGWKYQFIPADDETFVDAFVDKKFDLMGGTYYVDSLKEYFGYPDYNCGYTRAMLFARSDDPTIRSYDLSTVNGKKIGVFTNSDENIRRLKEYLAIQGLECEIVYYTNEDLPHAEDFHKLLENKEVDLLLENNAKISDEFNVIASFDSQAHYLVVQPEETELLAELNFALRQIYESDPNFATKVYEKNFQQVTTGHVGLTADEKEFVETRKTVTVAVPENWHPMFCTDGDDNHSGLVRDTLDEISAYSGLNIVYYACHTYYEGIQAVLGHKADVLGFFLGSETEANTYGLTLTLPYTELYPTVVRNKKVAYPSEGLSCGILKGNYLPPSIKAEKIYYYDNVKAALRAVNSGKIDFYYGTSAGVENVMRQENYNNVVQVSVGNSDQEISFAVLKPVDPILFSILNKGINSISPSRKNMIYSKNITSMAKNKLSLTDIIYSNPMLAFTVVTIIFVLILAIFLLVYRFRIKSTQTKTELVKAQAGNEAKTEFLSRMSHEIRTPMNVILGFAELTENLDGLSVKAKENLAKITTSSRHLLSLINGILDLSRIEKGKMELEMKPFHLAALLADIESMMTGDAERRSIEFKLISKISAEKVVGDSVRLRQVLLNLLSNALKFTKSGGKVVLKVEEMSNAQNTVEILFSVSDDGIGIAKADQEKIFGSFEQADSEAKSQGSGLGLAISRSIVRLMGGDLKVHSELGQGSEFYFTITFQTVAEIEDETTVPTAGDMFRGVNILLAEDNELNAEISCEMLAEQKAVVDWAADGRQALEMFEKSEEGHYQIILMDIQMPKLNGLEASRAIRALDRSDAKTVSIVALTANTFKEDIAATVDAGMNGFVPKPIDITRLYGQLLGYIKKDPGKGKK